MATKMAGSKNIFPGSCPVCGGRRLGRVGLDQYFCWDCCAQFSSGTQCQRVWEIADDGSLVPHAAVAAGVMGACGQSAELAGVSVGRRSPGDDLEARR